MTDLRLLEKSSLKVRLKGKDGYRYDQADYLINHAEYLFSIRLSDEVVFRNIMPLCWVICDDEHPRTLEAIATKIIDIGGLDNLVEKPPHPRLDSNWYARIRDIHDSFAWNRMGPIFLTSTRGVRKEDELDCGEIAKTPTASFAVLNGLHSSLALTIRLIEGVESYQPVEAILVLPRIDY